MKDPYSIVKRPLVTEKSMTAAAMGKYTFEVAPDANKIEIAEAVEKIFNVKVTKVNTVTVRGKTRRRYPHPEGKSRDWKKAIVTLVPGQRIEVFEGT